LRVLVVEDNYVLAESMRWSLGELGCEIVGPVPTAEEALSLIVDGVDAAILDIDLQGQSSAPAALLLRERGKPFVFLTGYENTALLPEELREAQCLNKPVDPEVLASALAGEVARTSSGPA